MPIGTQYKTSTIILNETLMGFEDSCELLNIVNHDFEQMIAQVDGMPTGGSVSVRSIGYPALQNGLTMSVSAIEQQYETVQVLTSDIIGNVFAVNTVEFEVDRNRVTDTTHYATAKAIATSVNKSCYNSLKYGTSMYVGSSASATVDFATIVNLNVVAAEMNIPAIDRTLLMNTRDYAFLATSINTGGIFDQPLTEKANQFVVGRYAGIPIVMSQVLYSLSQQAGTAGGDTLAFGVVTSTDSYRSAVITLTGGGAGATLKKGDRLKFATTKLISPLSKLATSVPLQLVVQADNTADGSGNFTGVHVVCGILPYSVSSFFGNVLAVPSTGENVFVEDSHTLNFCVVRPGFTFGTVLMQDISTLEIMGWGPSGNSKNNGSLTVVNSRNASNKSAPVSIRTGFDSDLLNSVVQMRIDLQPFYKTFARLNIALIAQLT